MDSTTLRAWWAARQGLDGSLLGRPPAEVLARTGWARSVAGVGPYLTLWSRARTTREAADKAVAQAEIHELPAARGCTYVAGASDYALALRCGQGFGTAADLKAAIKLGATEKEIDTLCLRVIDALAASPLDPDGLRDALGGAVRHFGPAGQKKGMATTLPVALGMLQSAGEIRRIPVNGRLDQQRYRYALWRPNPLAGVTITGEEAHTELARRYFRWIGPAFMAEFQWFSGLGARAARAAVAPLGLVPVDAGDERLLFPEDRDALASFRPPVEPCYAVVSSLDGINQLRRNLRDLVEPADESRAGPGVDLPNHAILDRGRLVGLWEYDPDAGAIVWTSFVEKSVGMRRAVAEAEAFVRDQVGDARSFSLDSPKSRAPKIAALRALR